LLIALLTGQQFELVTKAKPWFPGDAPIYDPLPQDLFPDLVGNQPPPGGYRGSASCERLVALLVGLLAFNPFLVALFPVETHGK